MLRPIRVTVYFSHSDRTDEHCSIKKEVTTSEKKANFLIHSLFNLLCEDAAEGKEEIIPYLQAALLLHRE